MKVLMLNGSCKAKGNTYQALEEAGRQLKAEGMQTMRNLARNMAWMLKCFEAGKASGVSLPAIERGSRTNFIR